LRCSNCTGLCNRGTSSCYAYVFRMIASRRKARHRLESRPLVFEFFFFFRQKIFGCMEMKGFGFLRAITLNGAMENFIGSNLLMYAGQASVLFIITLVELTGEVDWKESKKRFISLGGRRILSISHVPLSFKAWTALLLPQISLQISPAMVGKNICSLDLTLIDRKLLCKVWVISKDI